MSDTGTDSDVGELGNDEEVERGGASTTAVPESPQTAPPSAIAGEPQKASTLSHGHGQLGPYRSLSAQRAAPKSRAWFRPRELWGVLACIPLVDFTLHDGQGFASGGVGLGVLLSGLPLVAFATARSWRRSRRLAVVVALLVGVSLRTFIDPTVLTTLSGFGLAFVFSVALRKRDSFVPALLMSAGQTIWMLGPRVAAVFAGVRRASGASLDRDRVLPIAIPIGLTLAFAGVFALANPAVSDALFWVADVVLSFSWPDLPRIFLAAAAFFVGVALVRPSIKLISPPPIPNGLDTEASSTALDVARNSLVALNAIFAAYLVLDLIVILTGSAPSGMTTQEYAHQGAFWLTVALLMLTGVISWMFHGPLRLDERAHRVRTLAFVWIAQGVALALATYGRIGIHVAFSGLSNLRIVGVLGTSLVVLGMLLVGFKIKHQRSAIWLIRRQLDALAVTLILFALTPTHFISAHVNVARIEAGARAPLIHLYAQAQETESVTALLPLLSHEDAQVRAGVAGLLLHELNERTVALSERNSFREQDLLGGAALSALSAAAPQMHSALGETPSPQARHLAAQLGYAAIAELEGVDPTAASDVDEGR